MSECLDPTELATELKIPAATLSQWRYLGKGPAYARVGRDVRYRRADVDRWIEQHVQDGAS